MRPKVGGQNDFPIFLPENEIHYCSHLNWKYFFILIKFSYPATKNIVRTAYREKPNYHSPRRCMELLRSGTIYSHNELQYALDMKLYGISLLT